MSLFREVCDIARELYPEQVHRGIVLTRRLVYSADKEKSFQELVRRFNAKQAELSRQIGVDLSRVLPSDVYEFCRKNQGCF